MGYFTGSLALAVTIAPHKLFLNGRSRRIKAGENRINLQVNDYAPET